MVENILLILGVSFVIGIVVYSAIVASYRNLDSLEIVFLTVLGILISALVSYFAGKKSLWDEAQKRLEGEAKKALRRITVISQSAGRIYQNVQEKLDEFTSSSEQKTKKSNELIHEYFCGIGNQMQDLMANIKDSVEDWRDILPEEFKKLDEKNKKLAQAYKKAIQEKDAIERKYNAELKTKEDETEREAIIKTRLEELESMVAHYQAEIARIKSEYPPIHGFVTAGDPSYSLSDLLTGKPLQEAVRELQGQSVSDAVRRAINIFQEKPEEESKGKSEDNSTVAKTKDNSEKREKVSEPDNGPNHTVLKDDSEKEGSSQEG